RPAKQASGKGVEGSHRSECFREQRLLLGPVLHQRATRGARRGAPRAPDLPRMAAERTCMKLVSIEPTPNPNSMKLNLAESLPKGASRTYTTADQGDCPDYIARLLEVPGVKSLFHMADFIAVQ